MTVAIGVQLVMTAHGRGERLRCDLLPNDHSRVAKVVDGHDCTSIVDVELVAQLRALWAQHRAVLSTDFTLPADLASRGAVS